MAGIEGKVAIITGAASGVGEATALRFAREGAMVMAVDMNEAGLSQVVGQIEDAGGRAIPFTIDISDRERLAACFAATIDAFGTLDILVNNAGMSSAQGMDPSIDVWEKGIATTLSSVYWMSKAAVEHMKHHGGAIVNVASLAGNELGTPVAWYCGAKSGVAGLTRSFATTYGPQGIRTNAVAPGSVDTPRVRDILAKMPGQLAIHDKRSPIGRMGRAEEIASCIRFLASDEASYVNGQVLIADGGYALAM
jgi:3-oxoacyl-[acyl-carrier protein] reductase